jgi:nitrate reductase gamma subunit
MTSVGTILIVAAYCVYAAFWIRFFAHALVWWRAAKRLSASSPTPAPQSRVKVFALTAGDVFFFGRLLVVNPALWLGEWVFHVSLLLVLLRHLRYFLDPVPSWVWSIQFAGLIAGYVLLLSLVYILVIRLFTSMEKYASRANMFLLGLVLVISSIGIVMHAWLTPNLLDVKFFARGILCLSPAPAPGSLLFMAHFILVLVLVPFLPTHIFTAPLVMMEARKREQALYGVMHDTE